LKTHIEHIYLIVKWHVKPGHLEEVLEILNEVKTKSRAEIGNILYQAYQHTENPNEIYLYEAYANKEAASCHKESEYYQQLVAGKILPLLEEREVKTLTPIFGE